MGHKTFLMGGREGTMLSHMGYIKKTSTHDDLLK